MRRLLTALFQPIDALVQRILIQDQEVREEHCTMLAPARMQKSSSARLLDSCVMLGEREAILWNRCVRFDWNKGQ